MTVMGVMIVVLVVVGYIIYGNYVKANDLKIYIYGQRLSNHIADHINSLNAVSDGHSTIFSVPGILFGNREYDISFYSNESLVFLHGSTFTTGRDIFYSSPITTTEIYCIMPECNDFCNDSAIETCVNVTGNMDIRIVKHSGEIYLTKKYNAQQTNREWFFWDFQGQGPVDLNATESFLPGLGGRYAVVYVYRNLEDDSLSVVFKMNLTASDNMAVEFSDILGDVVDVDSNEDSEMEVDVPLGQPDGFWTIDTPDYDIDSGYITFKGGFYICIEPLSQMPSGSWLLLSSDGSSTELAKNKKVCISYP